MIHYNSLGGPHKPCSGAWRREFLRLVLMPVNQDGSYVAVSSLLAFTSGNAFAIQPKRPLTIWNPQRNTSKQEANTRIENRPILNSTISSGSWQMSQRSESSMYLSVLQNSK